eukprot:scaffold36314_cov31-Tisochrysis_lutea.AAC.6
MCLRLDLAGSLQEQGGVQLGHQRARAARWHVRRPRGACDLQAQSSQTREQGKGRGHASGWLTSEVLPEKARACLASKGCQRDRSYQPWRQWPRPHHEDAPSTQHYHRPLRRLSGAGTPVRRGRVRAP